MIDFEQLHHSGNKETISEAITRLLKTKARSWKYEKEYRSFPVLGKCRPKGGMYFTLFSDSDLKEVVAGSKCSVSDNYFRDALKVPSGEHATARRNPSAG
ncbi:MAG: hypothetical protein PSV13_20380 [Lacunisphaera sp.]|nr:hypothetical protein [Lacunisphaera sp.]